MKGPGRARRRSVAARPEERVTIGRYPDRELPFVVRPAVDGLDLIEWARESRGWIEERLLEHRALLFRGFDLPDVERFEAFVDVTSDGPRLEYRDRTTPRETRGRNVYTSTVHPPDQRIHLHNEGTYWTRFARKLYFACLVAAEKGGETPIADVRRVHDRIDPAVRAPFAEHGMMLVRNFNDGFGLPWQDVFQTEDRGVVESYCAENGIEFEWRDDDHLRTRQVRPAIRVHPATGEAVWFNHAAFFHPTSLEPEIRTALLAEYGEDGLPYATRYGDGTPIPDEVAEHLREAYAAERTLFPWEAGDLMLLDNMTVAHAREPFEGRREVVVAMTEAIEG